MVADDGIEAYLFTYRRNAQGHVGVPKVTFGVSRFARASSAE
jgi:hypothetical protein